MKRLMILILHLLTVSMCVYQRPTFKVILVTNLLYVEVNMLPNPLYQAREFSLVSHCNSCLPVQILQKIKVFEAFVVVQY